MLADSKQHEPEEFLLFFGPIRRLALRSVLRGTDIDSGLLGRSGPSFLFVYLIPAIKR